MPKSKYDTHVAPYLEKIAGWVEQGAEWKEIADNLHIGRSSLAKYLKLGRDGQEPYRDLAECFARAIEIPNEHVEAALYNLAIGYTVQLLKHYKVKTVDYDPDTGKKIREREELVKAYDEQHVPANVQAQMFYLANRIPEKWKYKPESKETEQDGETGVVEIPKVAEVAENG